MHSVVAALVPPQLVFWFIRDMRLLILSHVGDIHSKVTARALVGLGVDSEIFCFDEFPIASTITYDLTSTGPILRGPEADARLCTFDTVWNRRGWDPVFSAELDARDKQLAGPICRRFADEMRLSPPTDQLWINPRAAQLAMRSKAVQLRLAREIGFTIPRTIISNDVGAIRSFLSGPGEFIVKSIAPMSWTEDGAVVALPTTGIRLEQIVDEVSVQSCPMIYQERIEKSYELRVVVFGNRTLWVKLHSQEGSRYRDDWRQGILTEMRVEPVAPPDRLEPLILEFCRRANLLHASFDIAISPDGSAIFFEVNEQGQTLWIEEVNPEIRVLDMLVRFLADPLGRGSEPLRGERLQLADHLPLAA
jgi:glutathione synthase/RimK-type ligase-like ATP-grasp enzyme